MLIISANLPITNEMIKYPTITHGYPISNQLDLGDAYKLAISTKGDNSLGTLLCCSFIDQAMQRRLGC
ncbi:hypothetical protein L1987_33080 [Smallanthus sonchifolius]|uniref:Uncharacterized protein n=1 Tax=Smallanthus sonchifolius TaxID=185202 RepID=A0ACB9HSN0_9ASTR|nr:hypothetical protein L1987_33080 [Smallanthus sonchifolius]